MLYSLFITLLIKILLFNNNSLGGVARKIKGERRDLM